MKNGKKTKKKEKPKFHYSIMPDALQDDDNLEISEKFFWTVLYRWSKNKSSNHPSTMRSLKFFAEKVRVNRRTIQRWKAALIREGWVCETRRFNKTSVLILNKVKEESFDSETVTIAHISSVASNSIEWVEKLRELI